MKPMLVKADIDKVPCYLETGERNIALYKHFGFKIIEHMSLPEFDNDLYIMMRI